jgi:chromosome segregation protein
VSAPPRLLGLRLHGFKSFAERTVVEFGGGISAIVGPNGSGKSNLADALRWALGEQGRSLRTRKSEDVIFAGSERRAAIGMADVTLILDNADGLLPVDYRVLEIGRRLYRSGENDYLLNKGRVRLRDLVDLLDSAHLADNAFLFIGQGMVDQALALRPDERRPLFEEVAGVRRHERRRRRAEEQLTEAEANLARVQDILAELRPQARRLAAQAQQQTTRETAGEDLVRELLVAGHVRWYEAAARVAAGGSALTAARGDVDRAMAALTAAEGDAAAIARDLGTRTSAAAARRTEHDAASAALAEGRLTEARLAGELAATVRDRARLDGEGLAAEADLAMQRRIVAEPVPARDVDAEAELSAAERELADALAELATLGTARAAEGEAAGALKRAAAARAAELETARRRASDATRRAQEERADLDALAGRLGQAEREAESARAWLSAAIATEADVRARREAARSAAEGAEAERDRASEGATAARARAADLGARMAALRARMEEDEARPIATAVRRVGGKRVDAGLVVDPALRSAVETALGEIARAYQVERSAVSELRGARGTLVIAAQGAGAPPGARGGDHAPGRVVDRAIALGGGRLVDAVRTDPLGAASRWLAAAVWVPDLAALLDLQADLPPGWLAVVRDGSAAAGPMIVAFGQADGALERRATAEALNQELEIATTDERAAVAVAAQATEAAASARRALDEARAAEDRAASERRRAEEDERVAGRAREAAAREAAWQAAQVERLTTEATAAEAAVASMTAADASPEASSASPSSVDAAAVAAWERRADELRARRDRLGAAQAERDRARRTAEDRRARAETIATMDEQRLAAADREVAALVEREHSLRLELDAARRALAAAREREASARAALDAAQSADITDRQRLTTAEAAATEARDRLRAAETRSRSAEVADLEARLGLDAIREGLHVELAALGELGVEAIVRSVAGDAAVGAAPRASNAASPPAADDMEQTDDPGDDRALAAALDSAAVVWAETPPASEPPTAGRLATLRRRYHELGAANPFAVTEYAEVRERLEAMEAQERDLRTAIVDTRRLIEELSAMVADQFRTTFHALEGAFDARFRQLFGGGFARLSLTEPGDLASTGIEIVARPPGKKAQALAMLSGGERALTAVALLFAMLEVRPVPFCVLDEVDAALDEANVGRFAEALRSLADKTQFIVITHNRGTIETADALYGVTVGEDSVSRVISLRLDEATAIADRVALERVPVAG